LCFALYPFKQSPAPTTCSFQETPQSEPCGAKLFCRPTRAGNTQPRPALVYHHQIMTLWLAQLLAREGVEDLLDQDIALSTSPK
jgi:hypothetical protein